MIIFLLLPLSWVLVTMAQDPNPPICVITNNFNKNLLKARFDEQPDKSLIVSGYSLLTPLSQLLLASVGQTNRELLKVLGITIQDVMKTELPKAHTAVCTVPGFTFKEASRIYVQDGIKLNKKFVRETKLLFGSEIEQADMRYVAATAEINGWVEGQTNSKIKDLLQPNVPINAPLVLVNAVYLKAQWLYPFPVAKTMPKFFHVNKWSTIPLLFMNNVAEYMYTESKELNAKLVELPYASNGAKFVAVVPNEEEGLKDLMEKLDRTSIDNALSEMVITEVTLSLPKFKIDTTTDLRKTLQTLGVEALFTKSELTNLVEDSAPLSVDRAVQKGYIHVDENGTEVTVANAVVQVGSTMIPPPKATLDVDRPFYFEISIGTITLFSGVYQG